ncbi:MULTISPECIES: hypothetical protein [Caloramator]|jgi:chromosome segregation ATPase|uniref:Uncharacterized protein n=1 Tax=Caloramator australicus RC3 TaxID=857293 RepID=I7LJM1_9CLOT|nr:MULTISPECIES: hypothetical protein [Caloramator]MDO6355455.1 hypothetical protein [Caloramator sp. CAR-1]WDU84015.1 hypothetical protein PWK10_06145 [Caloramator sp. Dgby_cultured_2]CCJ33813.1 hypothetical protein CAAU_1729 [Caloramator australicus RC3]
MKVNYEEKLQILKEKIERAKNIKIKAETKLEALQKQKEEIIKQLEEMGINPNELEKEIKRLESEIITLIKEIEESLPPDNILYNNK